jgi:hypothetical protein
MLLLAATLGDWPLPVTKGTSESWLTREQLNRFIECTQHPAVPDRA